MNIPVSVKKYLAQQGGQYKVRQAQAGTDLLGCAGKANILLQQLACTQVIKDGSTFLMAVYPANHRLDLTELNSKSRRRFESCDAAQLRELFPDCDRTALPPFGAPYGLKVIVDPALDAYEEVYFPAGLPQLFIRAGIEDFRSLQAGARRDFCISKPFEEATFTLSAMKEKVQDVSELPSMPGVALQIIQVRNNPFATPGELASVVEQDPSLAAQIMRYAASPIYAYHGRVDSVAVAIDKVLGMDFVMDLAFGLALGKSFNNPKGGPIGLDAFWRHATYCASLTQKLCNQIDFMSRPSPGMAYLSGLLHNFGVLLMGHHFPAQFTRLNQAMAQYPHSHILKLEREQLGVTHTEMGVWLMEAWGMPHEIVNAVREHHNHKYCGPDAVYAGLVHVANRLLKRHGIGDAESMDLPEEMLEDLGLDIPSAEEALGKILEGRESIEFMAARMAA